MIQKYKIVSVIYGGKGREYAEQLSTKITDLAQTERYPISAKLIMERILTQELLSGVMELFRESEFCVAFLTADDCCVVENNQRKRLRQNVVFELGMAIIRFGRDRCILLSDFDVHDPVFELPSDMSSLAPAIRCFTQEDYSAVLDEVIVKLHDLSRNSPQSGIPQYNDLLRRPIYYVDYENIFVNRITSRHAEGSAFLKETLDAWFEECSTLPNYDEKCIFLFERIGFLPIFGKIPEADQWLRNTASLMEHYADSDISYYGNTALLNFVSDVIRNIIEYTRIKTVNNRPILRDYQGLLRNFNNCSIPADTEINPLIMVVYHNYLGLTNMKLYLCCSEEQYIRQARKSFEKAIEFVDKVDMSLQIWTGFITYNLARACAALNDTEEAQWQYDKAISIRERWLKNSSYNITVRNALSSEYFLAKIDYLDMCKKHQLLSHEEIEEEYKIMEAELNTYCDVDDRLEQLLYVLKILESRRKGKSLID